MCGNVGTLEAGAVGPEPCLSLLQLTCGHKVARGKAASHGHRCLALETRLCSSRLAAC